MYTLTIKGLAEMTAEGGAYINAMASDSILQSHFPLAAATLIGNYRWGQSYANLYCPYDQDQGQPMAERLVKLSEQMLG
jgi:hypothetical protein